MEEEKHGRLEFRRQTGARDILFGISVHGCHLKLWIWKKSPRHFRMEVLPGLRKGVFLCLEVRNTKGKQQQSVSTSRQVEDDGIQGRVCPGSQMKTFFLERSTLMCHMLLRCQ